MSARILLALSLGLLAAPAHALTINPMLQNNMVLQRNDGTVSSLINGTAAIGSTVTIQWPCPDPVGIDPVDGHHHPCTSLPVFGPRTLATADVGQSSSKQWFYNLAPSDPTDISTITTYTDGQRMRITIDGDTTNCAAPSGWLFNGAVQLMAGTDVAGVVGGACAGGAQVGLGCLIDGDCPGSTCTHDSSSCIIDMTGAIVGENWVCSGQSAFDEVLMGHTCQTGEAAMQFCSLWPAIRGSTETSYTWHDDVSASCFWLAVDLQNKLRVPIGIIQRALAATAIQKWEGESICADPEMWNVIATYGGNCSNQCAGGSNAGNPCLTITDCPGGLCNYEATATPTGATATPTLTPTGGTRTPTPTPTGATPTPTLALSTDPHQTGSAWGDLYRAYLYPMWPFGIRGVYWFQGLNDTGNDRNYRHALPGLPRSWRRDRDIVAASIGGLPPNDLPVFWMMDTPKGSGATRCTECPPDTSPSHPERSLWLSEPGADVADFQDNEIDDPMHAAYHTGRYGEQTGGCRRLYPAPTPAVSACGGSPATFADGQPVVPCDNCYMLGSTDLEAALHPKNSEPFARLIAQAALVKVYGQTALMPGFSNAWSGPLQIGMRLGTPGGGQLPINLCFDQQTAVGLFGMQIPEPQAWPPARGPNPYELHGFKCWDPTTTPKWQFAPAFANGEQIFVLCPSETPILFAYDKSRFESPYTLWGNVFNGDTLPLPSFIVDVADKNLDQCVLASTPTPIPTATGPTVTPTATPTPTPTGATPTPTGTPMRGACIDALTGVSGAIAGYHFDELLGFTAYDNVAGFDGSYTNVILGAASLIGDTDPSALFGDEAFMQVEANAPDFFLPTEQSFVVFVQTSGPSQQFISQQDAAGVTTRLALTMSGGMVTLTAGIGSVCSPVSISSSRDIDDAKPHLIVGVFNTSQQLELYVDNDAVVQSSTALGVLCPALVGGVITVGANAGLSAFSNAVIDEPRIYGRALSGGDVASLASVCVSRWVWAFSGETAVVQRVGDVRACGTPAAGATPAAPYVCAVTAAGSNRDTAHSALNMLKVIEDIGPIERCTGHEPATFFCQATPTPGAVRRALGHSGYSVALDATTDIAPCVNDSTFVAFLCTAPATPTP